MSAILPDRLISRENKRKTCKYDASVCIHRQELLHFYLLSALEDGFYTGTTDVFVTPQGTHAKLTTKH